MSSMRERGGSHPIPIQALLAAGLVASILPAAPLVADANRAVGIPLQAPLLFAWFFAALALKNRHAGGLGAAWLFLICSSLTVSINQVGPDVLRAWVGVILVPTLIFAGLQAIPSGKLGHATLALRFALLLTTSLQVYYYWKAVGLSRMFSPRFVIGSHTDISLWREVGARVLANPTNASVIFCTAFALAVSEVARGKNGKLNWALAITSSFALWVTGSRGAYLTAGMTILLVSIGQTRLRARLAVMTLAGAALLFAGNYWLSRFASGAQTGRSFETRMQAREATIPVVLNNPFGHGPGTTPQTLRSTLESVDFLGTDVTGATSHDLFLNWGVSLGWVGLTLLIAGLFVALHRSYTAGGVVAILPLTAYIVSGEATGIDILNGTNAAWATVLAVLIGIGWRANSIAARELRKPPEPSKLGTYRANGVSPGVHSKLP